MLGKRKESNGKKVIHFKLLICGGYKPILFIPMDATEILAVIRAHIREANITLITMRPLQLDANL